MPDGSQPAYEIALTHFIVAGDVEALPSLLYGGARRQDHPLG